MKIRVKGILFDMDGILVSSIGSVERSWTKWAVMHNLDPEFAIKSAHGRRSIDSIRVLRPELDAELENDRIEAWRWKSERAWNSCLASPLLSNSFPRIAGRS